MFCVKCGAKAPEEALFCTQCGARLDSGAAGGTTGVCESIQTADPDDDGGFIWSFLALCIPLVGLILYLKWRSDRPATARACLAGLLIWVVLAGIGLLLSLIILFVIFVLI